METAKRTVALIVAAGSGSRAGGNVPKQFRQINGKPLLRHSYETFTGHNKVERAYVVIASGQEEMANAALAGLPVAWLVTGGDTRQASVLKGLEAIEANGGADFVLIHDAARPFLQAETIDLLIEALSSNEGAVPALPVVDSLARGNGLMQSAVERDGLWRIQTPQAFHFATVFRAHKAWKSGDEATDDARMVTALGVDVALVAGDDRLTKYTFAQDFDFLPQVLGASSPMRTGSGFDVHRYAVGEELWLCGIRIDYHLGLEGHSDADVALHALTDAVLGALALGDIGDHFPPSDPKWSGAASDQFLRHAVQLATEKGYCIGNVDLTIICEAPKIGPHREAMRSRIAEIMNSSVDQVSVKATTSERLGFTGRGEGIAAQAIATLVKLPYSQNC